MARQEMFTWDEVQAIKATIERPTYKVVDDGSVEWRPELLAYMVRIENSYYLVEKK